MYEYEVKFYIGIDKAGLNPLEDVAAIADKYLTGYTLALGIGCWKGQRENSVILTHIAERENLAHCHGLKAALKAYFEQESILMTITKLEWVGF